ncbi:ribosomal protein L4 [Exidia glandulosa HHB12029]|uniref:Large ribosomal subunit protein uL4m n=1 Tax=Exidia glandulosa HHB12029 TaxID=1314781 RepID=A0A165PBR9_EXIGL|nr:ribosomal protein L4 [Exidia glandulosa HHB12029]
MFRLGTRAATALCAIEGASLTLVRGARVRALPAPPKKAAAARRPKPPTTIAPVKHTKNLTTRSKQPERTVLKAVPLPRSSVYIEVSHLIPPPEGSETRVAVLDPDVFAAPIRRDILHRCVVHYLDGTRQGSAHTKTRAEVRGSGRKIRPQKGTGRARLGDGQSPMLKGGGVAFGPRPRDFSTKLPRKVRAFGMRIALSSRVREQSIIVVDSFDWPGVKTKEFRQRLEALSWGRCLFVVGRGEETFKRIKRVSKIDGILVIKVEDLDLHTILRWPRLVLDVEALEWLETKWHPSSWEKVQSVFQSEPVVVKGHNLPPPSFPSSIVATASL